MDKMKIAIGFTPGVSSCGYGAVAQVAHKRIICLGSGVIEASDETNWRNGGFHSRRAGQLSDIYEDIKKLIASRKPLKIGIACTQQAKGKHVKFLPSSQQFAGLPTSVSFHSASEVAGVIHLAACQAYVPSITLTAQEITAIFNDTATLSLFFEHKLQNVTLTEAEAYATAVACIRSNVIIGTEPTEKEKTDAPPAWLN